MTDDNPIKQEYTTQEVHAAEALLELYRGRRGQLTASTGGLPVPCRKCPVHVKKRIWDSSGDWTPYVPDGKPAPNPFSVLPKDYRRPHPYPMPAYYTPLGDLVPVDDTPETEEEDSGEDLGSSDTDDDTDEDSYEEEEEVDLDDPEYAKRIA